MDEAALIRAAVGGDSEAFAELIKIHREELDSFILRMIGDPIDAADLSQETLIQAYQELRSFRGQSEFTTRLFVIASRKCIDHLHRRKRWPTESS